MDIIEAILKRRSIRKYRSEPISKKVIEEIFEIASHSPIAPALKQHEYYVLLGSKREDLVRIVSQNTAHLREVLEILDEASRERAVKYYADLGGAPVVILIVVPKTKSIWEFKSVATSCGTEIMLLELAALARGLSTCCFTMAPWIEEEVAKLLGLPEEKTVLYGMTLGYGDEIPPPLEHPKAPVHFVE